MNIKEKLLELGIDVENDKESITKAKDKLKSYGKKADRINTKLDEECERILEELFSNKIFVEKKSEVKAPPTIKHTDDIPLKDNKKNKKSIIKDEISSQDSEKTKDIK